MSGATRNSLATIGRGLRELLRVRWVRVAVVLAFLIAAVRFGGVWMLGRTVKSLAREHGLACSWEELDLSVLDGHGAVRFLSFAPVPGAGHAADRAAGSGEPSPAPLLEIEYAVFDLDVRALLRGELSVRRAEVDGLDSRLERGADGTWNVEQHVDVAELLSMLEAGEGEEPAASTASVEPRAIRLAPPLAVAALRIQHARLRLIDRAVSPELDTVLEANVRLSNLGAQDRRVRFTVTVTGSELLDGATLDGAATWQERSLALELTAQAGSFRPGPLAPYLASFRVEPRAESIEARCDVALTLEVVGEAQDTLTGRLAITDLGLAADGEATLRVDEVEVELGSASAAGVRVPHATIRGVRGGATLEARGAIDAGGFALLPGPPRAAASPNASVSTSFAEALAGWASLWAPERYPRWAALFARSDPDAFPWSLERFAVSDVALALIDESVAPGAQLELLVDTFELGPVVHDPALARASIPLAAALRAPGVAETIRVEGSLAPFAPQRGADVTLLVEGIGLDALAPYLKRAGVEDTLERGTLRAHLVAEATTDAAGRTEGWIELEELALTGDDELFGVRSMAARELVIDPAQGLVRLGNVEIAGPRLLLARDPSRGFLAFGLRTLGGGGGRVSPGTGTAGNTPETGGAPVSTAEPAPSAPAAAALPIPRLELGRLAWIDTDVAFVDAAVEPRGRILVEELGFELFDLTLGGDPAGPEPAPARFSARFAADDLAEELRIEGSIRSKPGPIDLTAELNAAGRGLQGRFAAPYLRALGIEPALTNGSLSGSIAATLREADGGWRATLRVRDAELTDAGTPLLGLGELAVEDVALDADGITVGRVSVVRPFAHVVREADGALRAAGLRVLAEEAPAATPAATSSAAPAALTLPALPAARIAALEVREARLRWSDRAAPEPVELDLTVAVELARLDCSGVEPGTFAARLALPGVIELLAIDGALQLAPERWTLTADVTGRGLSGAQLVPYLPPNVRPSGEPGTFQGRFAAHVAPHADGGLSASCRATELGLGSGDAGERAEPSLAVASAALVVARFDPRLGVVQVDAIETEGVELALRRDLGGAVHALGFVLDPAPSRAAAAALEPEAGTPTARTPGSRTPPPRVEILQGIDVGVDRLVLRDESLGADARPIAARFGLRLDGPCVLVDRDPRELPPVEFELAFGVDGLCDATIGVAASPFADPAEVHAHFDARNVRAQGLIEALPALAPLVRGEVETGSLTAELDVQLDVRRSAPYDLGLARAFGLELRLVGADYFGAPGARALAGVDEVLVEGRIDPARGRVQLKTIDVRNPHGFVHRDAGGVHALGFLIAAPAAAEVAVEPPASEGPVTVAAARPVEASMTRERTERTPQEPSSGELRIDELLVSGLDFLIVDETGAPPLRIPLTGLDAELKRFTTKMFAEPRPVSFSAYLAAGSDEGRPVFDEVAVSGRIALAPEPKGWAQVNLASLELVPFAGLAATNDMTVGDGALDANVRVRLKGERGGTVDASLVFTDLALAEQDGGPIQRLLSLPASLDAVLFLLRNQDGEHRFTVGFPVTEDGLSTSSLALAAAGAATEVVVRAVAGAPLRLVGGLIPGSGGPSEAPRATWSFDFEPGGVVLPAAASAAFERAAERLNARGSLVASVRHEVAAEDFVRAASLANPERDECLELASGLRQRKAELLRARDELATEARTLFAIGKESEALAATDELRGFERRILATEDGLDRLFGIVSRDSPRQRDKRTRAACRELAEERLRRVADALGARIERNADERIDLRSPRAAVVDGIERSRIVIELRER